MVTARWRTLNLLNYIFPVGGVVLRFILTSVFVLLGLVAKGAIAAFYLRERGSYSEDGAAYITAQDEPSEVLAGAAADRLTQPDTYSTPITNDAGEFRGQSDLPH